MEKVHVVIAGFSKQWFRASKKLTHLQSDETWPTDWVSGRGRSISRTRSGLYKFIIFVFLIDLFKHIWNEIMLHYFIHLPHNSCENMQVSVTNRCWLGCITRNKYLMMSSGDRRHIYVVWPCLFRSSLRFKCYLFVYR